MPEYGNHYAIVKVLLEDVTEATRDEFWRALHGFDIEVCLEDGLDYVAQVVQVDPLTTKHSSTGDSAP
jgi:hypothetical protein